MFKTIERAADCEIRSVIRFLNARNVLPSEILLQDHTSKCPTVYTPTHQKLVQQFILQNLWNYLILEGTLQ